MFGDYILPVETTAAAPQAAVPLYLEPADLSDVLHEQLDFLLSHEGHDAPGCSDCQRLARVVNILMQPFA